MIRVSYVRASLGLVLLAWPLRVAADCVNGLSQAIQQQTNAWCWAANLVYVDHSFNCAGSTQCSYA